MKATDRNYRQRLALAVWRAERAGAAKVWQPAQSVMRAAREERRARKKRAIFENNMRFRRTLRRIVGQHWPAQGSIADYAM